MRIAKGIIFLTWLMIWEWSGLFNAKWLNEYNYFIIIIKDSNKYDSESNLELILSFYSVGLWLQFLIRTCTYTLFIQSTYISYSKTLMVRPLYISPIFVERNMCVYVCVRVGVCNVIHRQNIYTAIAFDNWIHLKSSNERHFHMHLSLGLTTCDWNRYIRRNGRQSHTKPDSNWIMSLQQWPVFQCLCKQILDPVGVKSCPPSATYMRQWIAAALGQIVACPGGDE